MSPTSVPTLATPMLHPAEAWRARLTAAESRATTALLQSESAGGRHQQSVYELFAEMEEKDGHLYSVIQTRVNGLLGLPRVVRAGSSPQAAEVVSRAIERIPRFDDLLRALLDGLAKGFAAVELLWDYDDTGRLAIADWIAHPQEYFLFDERGRLLLLSPPFRDSGARDASAPLLAAGRATVPAARASVPPAFKFVPLVFGRDARNPYGRGLCQRAYWFYWLKKNALKMWSIANERHGAPTAVASYPPGTSEDERRRLLDALASLQTDAGIVVPDGINLRLLESPSTDGSTFRALADWCNDEMAKIVLGATLTTGEGRRSGSLALGAVHDAVRQEYIEADARLLASVLNGTIVRWIVELNMAQPPREMPAWSLDATPPADLEQQARIDQQLVSLGVPVPLAHFHERYGRRAPQPGERAITYDDSNLFQYHLKFGVLTINEVRARLHLAPVPWGDRPTIDNSKPDPHDTGTREETREREREIERRTAEA